MRKTRGKEDVGHWADDNGPGALKGDKPTSSSTTTAAPGPYKLCEGRDQSVCHCCTPRSQLRA